MTTKFPSTNLLSICGRTLIASLLCVSACAVDTGAAGHEGDGNDIAPSAGNAGQVAVSGGTANAASGIVKAPPGADLRAVKHWFIELEGVPLAEAGDYQALDEAVDHFRQAAFDSDLAYTERHRFDTLVHGVSVSMNALELGKLTQLKGVKAVYPICQTKLPEFKHQGPGIDMKYAVGMTGADVVQNTLHFKGNGIKVGIIDTGIDVDHPDFWPNGAKGSGISPRIDMVHSYDFVGDDYQGDVSAAVPDGNPDDCAGHGTHVAGIIGASGNPATNGVVGVAPEVTFQVYRVFGCKGSTNDDIIMQAIERAYTNGAQVINLSLGSDNQWSGNFYAMALGRVLSLGVVPVAAAGNNGGNGMWTVGAPGGGDDVVTVASVDNAKQSFSALKLGDNSEVPYVAGSAAGMPVVPTTGTGTVVYVGQGCPADAAAGTAEDTYLAQPNGKIALITRGACNFQAKIQRAQMAGATGVLIENNGVPDSRKTEPPFGMSLEAGNTIWAASLSYADGATLKGLITGGNATITFLDTTVDAVNPTAGLVSGFSSWGPSPELLLKPDISAPGGGIRSTVPLSLPNSTGYDVYSGTSMATPHIAGAVALLLDAKPGLAASKVRSILQNTAQQQATTFVTGEDAIDSPVHQGAGLLRIDTAIQSTTFVSPSKVELGEGQAGAVETPFFLTNDSGADVTYTFGTVAKVAGMADNSFDPNPADPRAYALGLTTKVEFFTIGANGARTKATQITVLKHSVGTFAATITPPTAWDNTDFGDTGDGVAYGGFITLTASGSDTKTVSIPFAGVTGDYQALDPVVTPVVGAAEGELVLFKQTDILSDSNHNYSEGDLAEPGHAYSMKDGDNPAAGFRLAYGGAAKATVYLVPHGDLSWLGAIKNEEVNMLGRSDADSGSNSLFWIAGSEFGAGKLPDGVYHFRIDLLKALGDPQNKDHHRIIESEAFKIDRSLPAPDWTKPAP